MTEKRRGRASFTKTLEVMCKRLDDNPCTEMAWEHPLVHGNFTSTITIKSLWAVGSYARGAPTCGDLDIVAEMTAVSGPPPPHYEVTRALFKSPKGVSLYLGTPTENSSGTAFPEALMIWTGAGSDWRGAIARIATDLTAVHFPRHTDRIPFRMDQLSCSLSELEELLTLYDQQLIRWQFVPLGEIDPIGTLSEDELELSKAVQFHCGKITRALLPHLITHFRQPTAWTKPYLRSGIKKTQFRIGGTKVLVGRPAVPVQELDWLTTSELLIVPHQSARGPNGIWRIERGDKHPLLIATGKLPAWTLANSTGQPDFSYHLAEGDPINSSSARGIDLFTSLAGAQDWIDQVCEECDAVLSPKELTGRELLSCLARADVAAIDRRDYAVSHRGKVALGCSEMADSGSLLDALAGRAG